MSKITLILSAGARIYSIPSKTVILLTINFLRNLSLQELHGDQSLFLRGAKPCDTIGIIRIFIGAKQIPFTPERPSVKL